MTLAPFISLDGVDGTGKSTQCRLLVDWLNANGVPAIGASAFDRARRLPFTSRMAVGAGAHIKSAVG